MVLRAVLMFKRKWRLSACREYKDLYDAVNIEFKHEISVQASKINGYKDVVCNININNIRAGKIRNVSRETLPTFAALW